MIWPNRTITIGDLSLRATFAIPFAGDDLTHVGYLVSVPDGPKFYVTGDTGYHDILAISMADHKPDILAAVINPAFRNMSPADAAGLAQKIDAKIVIPCHYDLFPDNSLPPQLLHTNLKILGLGDRYRRLEHGRPYVYPEIEN
jgi:L-ascorbate 6-phosphate lactonase